MLDPWIALPALLSGTYVGARLVGSARWGRRTRALESAIESARLSATSARHDARELEGLPVPVQRYLARVLRDGQPLAEEVRLAHRGELAANARGGGWRPFRSKQRVVLRRPGFVWDARIGMLPGLPVHVHDAYVAGEGILCARLFGLLPLTELRGRGEVARGELLRFLAEAAWYPAALLPSRGVAWSALGEREALATLTDGEVSASLAFRFGADGLVRSVRCEDRGRALEGSIVPTPWEGRWLAYAERGGSLVPVRAEVAWILPEGELSYWRAELVGFEPALGDRALPTMER